MSPISVNNRAVELTKVWGSEDDMQVNAVFCDTGTELSDEELSILYQDYFDLIVECWLDRKIAAADNLLDFLKEAEYDN
jgi:hypothetical protein